MILSHVWGLLIRPDQEWLSIRENPPSILALYLGQVIWLAAIPALCTFYGTTQIGWSLPGSSEVIRLTIDSAMWMAILAWLAMLCAVAVMGLAVQWMSQTFGSKPSITQSISFSTYTASPLFLAGVSGVYPSLWLLLIAGTFAAAASAYFLYNGLPAYMNISKEQGFVYASSILCIGLVVFIALMIVTILFWSMGVGPEYVQMLS